ncbi:glycoside hydrolase family 88 protein [Gramella sp. AN32]|uniref:Glycoside hydrolase family 105 protein n=1 Tax=Christiangramia antarctica TaxID=2058158 RepID=A0ABW5X298_9FLAO|nr:glycoside hydrolase family 88 protein [Gramella sp. AN32]MCM4157245.1 family 88 glycosyl hydrolase [Gramella sp. AN32]
MVFNRLLLIILGFSIISVSKVAAQINDATTPLHLLKPAYPTPYKAPEISEVKNVLDRVYNFLDQSTPADIINSKDSTAVKNFKNLDANIAFAPASFRLTSYEWGVTYAGMLLASQATGENYFKEYTNKRLKLIAEIANQHRGKSYKKSPVHSVLHPSALDDAGAICAAMIKAQRDGLDAKLDPVIENFIDYISNDQFRLKDGTLARNRPQNNTLWLDDLFMSIPALAQMGKRTENKKYFDDAVKQVKQFSFRMFNKEKGLYMHGWVQEMEERPQYHWARANGWAVMAMVELLEVLPENHPGYEDVLKQLQAHIKGLSKYQDGTGFWHQLIDRNDTYLETSATAIFAYAILRAINRGYIDKMSYSPMAILAWNAVSTKVNEQGQVEGTCVGTGMGFDPAFYYYRPINKYAAHGYGPVLLAGAEMILLLKNNDFEINDSSLQLKVKG